MHVHVHKIKCKPSHKHNSLTLFFNVYFLMSIECQEHITHGTAGIEGRVFDIVWSPVPADIKRFTFTLQGTGGLVHDAYLMLSPTATNSPGIPKIGKMRVEKRFQ